MDINQLSEVTFSKEHSLFIKDCAESSIRPFYDFSDTVQRKAYQEICFMKNKLDTFTVDRIIATIHKSIKRIDIKKREIKILLAVIPEDSQAHSHVLKTLEKYNTHIHNLQLMENILACNI